MLTVSSMEKKKQMIEYMYNLNVRSLLVRDWVYMS